MSIAHELSSEVAAALLADGEGESHGDSRERAEVVLEVHSTLRSLRSQYRKRGRAASDDTDAPPLGEAASSGRR
jgi:hypothetical protein